MGAGFPNQRKDPYMTSSHNRSGYPSISATGRVADNMALYGYTPGFDEPETRPMPESQALDGLVAGLFDAMSAPLENSGLEPDIQDLMWSLVDVLHRKADRVQRMLDDTELKLRASHDEQDGSEVRSVELERLIDKAKHLEEKRTAFEQMRDTAGERYADYTGSPWRPRTGSLVNHRNMTAAMVDGRAYLNAKRRSETEVLLPEGPRVVFVGGANCNDHHKIWSKLDLALAKVPGMVLFHGGQSTGAELIAARWADHRKVKHVAFKPDFNRHGRSAPFKRNDILLELAPVGVIVFPGTGIVHNLADKANQLGIPLADYRS